MEIGKLINKTTFIVGNRKNAGKTTFLNFALAGLRKRGPVAYLSIGVDGEGVDAITGGHKPKVYAQEGDLLVTTESALHHSNISAKVINVFPYKTVLGRSLLVKVASGGFIELIGPENNSQLAEICAFIQEEQGIRTLLIDGAVNRITQVGSSSDAGFVYVARIDPSNLQSSVDAIRSIYLLSLVPRAGKVAKWVEVEGALTKEALSKLEAQEGPLLLEDMTKVFLNPRETAQVAKIRGLLFRRTFEFRFVIANLFDVEEEHFKKVLADPAIIDKVIFNPLNS